MVLVTTTISFARLLLLPLLACAAAEAIEMRRPRGGPWAAGGGSVDAAVGAAASVARRGRDAPQPRAQLQPLQDAAWLNAKDFGAKGDGRADDSAALQTAIDASLAQQQLLLVPSGIYVVLRQLNVSRGNCTNANLGCEMGLIMRGESFHLTEIRAGARMHAVLNFTCLSGAAAGAAAPIPTEGHHISDISIYGQVKFETACVIDPR
eukprot:SAG31_NODE_7940_length_1559_cov_2.336301_2_plen_207_part_00